MTPVLLVSSLAATALALSLTACASAPDGPAAATPPASGRCNAASSQTAVGRLADAALQADVKQRSGARIVRVLRPDQIVTMEFNAERLNLSVDRDGRINRVSCG